MDYQQVKKSILQTEGAFVIVAMVALIAGLVDPFQQVVSWGSKASKIIEAHIPLQLLSIVLVLRSLLTLMVLFLWVLQQGVLNHVILVRVVRFSFVAQALLSLSFIGAQFLTGGEVRIYAEFATINEIDVLFVLMEVGLLVNLFNKISTTVNFSPEVRRDDSRQSASAYSNAIGFAYNNEKRERKDEVSSEWGKLGSKLEADNNKSGPIKTNDRPLRLKVESEDFREPSFLELLFYDGNEFLSGTSWLFRFLFFALIGFCCDLMSAEYPIFIVLRILSSYLVLTNHYKRFRSIGYNKMAMPNVISIFVVGILVESYYLSKGYNHILFEAAWQGSDISWSVKFFSGLFAWVQFLVLLFSNSYCYLGNNPPQSFRHLSLRKIIDYEEVAALLTKAIDLSKSTGETQNIRWYLKRKSGWGKGRVREFETENFLLAVREVKVKEERVGRKLLPYNRLRLKATNVYRTKESVKLLTEQLAWIQSNVFKHPDVCTEQENKHDDPVGFLEPDMESIIIDLGYSLYVHNFQGRYGLGADNPICVGNSRISEYVDSLAWDGLKIRIDWILIEKTVNSKGEEGLRIIGKKESPIARMEPVYLTRKYASKSYFRYSPDSKRFSKT